MTDPKSKHRVWNKEIIDVLKSHHADLSRPHLTHHVFYTASEILAKKLAGELAAAGYDNVKSLRSQGQAEDGPWSVEAEVLQIPSQEGLDFRTDQCIDLAALCHATYDGWYTEPET